MRLSNPALYWMNSPISFWYPAKTNVTALRPLSFITFIISSIASPEKSDWPRCSACVSWYASSTKRMPPRASLIFFAVFIAVWLT